MNKETIECSHCGMEFATTKTGRGALLRHNKSDCPKNPKSAKYKELHSEEAKVEGEVKVEKEIVDKGAEPEKKLTYEQRFDQEDVLDKIIAEASETKKRGAIVRMVARTIGKNEESIRTLADALRIGGIIPSQRNLIMRNWANYLEVEDYEKILKKDKELKKEDEGEEEEDEKKISVDPVKEVLKKYKARKAKHLEDLMATREIADMEQELSGETKKEEEEERKLVQIIDGVSFKVTPEEKRSWMRYEEERKKAEEEREDRKEERRLRFEQEKTPKKDNELVEWVIGDGKEARTIKVRPETIPMLIQSQGKKEEGGEVKELREDRKEMRDEMSKMRDQFQSFQTAVLQKEIEEMKTQLSVDPIDRLFQNKEKLEKMGMVSSAKATAQDKMYSMEGKKLDTMLGITMDKSRSLEKKIDTLVDVFGPLAKDYVRESVVTMRKQRGETGEAVPHTETEMGDALKSLEEVEKEMMEPNAETKKSPSVITIEKTEKKPETAEKEG